MLVGARAVRALSLALNVASIAELDACRPSDAARIAVSAAVSLAKDQLSKGWFLSQPFLLLGVDFWVNVNLNYQ